MVLFLFCLAAFASTVHCVDDTSSAVGASDIDERSFVSEAENQVSFTFLFRPVKINYLLHD